MYLVGVSPWSARDSFVLLLKIVFILVLGLAVAIPINQFRYVTAVQESIHEVTRESICGFALSLYRDFGEFGCCVESPVVEPDVCYTSTNLLAEYVLRNICGRSDLADKIKAFLNRYPTDFYDYYQILVSKPFTLPFTSIEHVQADIVNSTRVVHVKRADTPIEDYDRYANLVAYKVLYHINSDEMDKALEELGRLNTLFDGRGFADMYYRLHGKYEAYKIALAIIACRALGHTEKAESYRNILLSIKPFTTLYEENFRGIGDLNLETACLTAIALYTEPSLETEVAKAVPSATPKQVVLAVIATAIVIAVALILYVLTPRHRKSCNLRPTCSSTGLAICFFQQLVSL